MESLLPWLLPFGICLARIADVSIGTLRIVMIAREKQLAATLLGFFEVLIWISAIGVVMANLDAWWNVLAYALGYAAGNWVGLSLQRWMAMGEVGVRIITADDATLLVNGLRSLGFGVTLVPAHGSRGPVSVIYLITHRRDMPKVVEVVHAFNPKAFYTLEDIRFVSSGVRPMPEKTDLLDRLLKWRRKEHPKSALPPELAEPEIPSPAAGGTVVPPLVPRT